MDLYEVVTKLTGPISPVGDSRIDAERLKNLGAMCDLVNRLVTDIDDVSRAAGEHMASVREARNRADHFLSGVLGIAS